MPAFRRTSVATTAALIFLPATAATAGGTPIADEFRVNVITATNEHAAQVAVDAQGDYAVVWVRTLNASDSDVFARVYSHDGTPKTSEITVQNPLGIQDEAEVAMDAAGDFVVVWESGSNETDGSGFGIFAQRYGASGTAVGGAFQVNVFTTGDQTRPTVAMDAVGNFVVAWQDSSQEGTGNSGIYARRFDATGTALGG